MRQTASMRTSHLFSRAGIALLASSVVFIGAHAEATGRRADARHHRMSPRQPEAPSPLHRGAELVAIRDTELHRARIEGARVTVVEVRFANGAPVAVSLALPDGYVLHDVAYDRVTQSFRPTRG
jgi:hypothetical protein